MSQFISLAKAVAMTTEYRQNRETILGAAYKNQNILCLCETFDRGVFDDVLGQTGCVGLRIYYGMTGTDKQVHAVIVGVNSANEDMISSSSDVNLIIDEGRRCPFDCPPASDLNS